MSQEQRPNLKYLIEGMKPLFVTLKKEIDESSDLSGAEKKRQNASISRDNRIVDLFAKLVVDLLEGMDKSNEEKHEEVIAESSRQQTNQDKLEEEVIQTKKKQERLEKEIIKNKLENDKQEQMHKFETIKIHNITAPSSATREDVYQSVLDYFKDADIPVDKDQIKSAVRPSKGTSKSPHIYCTFFRGSDKINVLRQRKNKMSQNTDFQRKRPNSFVTEDLTPLRQLIAFKLRKDPNRIAKSWSMDGKIKCLKVGHSVTDTPITIETPYDLKKAGWSNDEVQEFIQQNLVNNED